MIAILRYVENILKVVRLMEIRCQNNVISIITKTEVINVVNCNFDNSETYTLLLDPDGSIIYSCSEFVSKNKHIGDNISNLLNPNEYETFRKLMIQVIFTNTRIVQNLNIHNRCHKIIITPILDRNFKVKFLLVNGCDVTKTQKIINEIEILKDKLKYSDSIKNIFLSNISHELRTPMNAIIGFSDLLLSDKDTPQLENFLKSINSNAIHLDELLNNILDYSKMESKEFDLLYEKFSINELFEELNNVFSQLNYKKNLDFVKLEFIINEDRKIISDYLRLKQILFNIISNSIKFTNKGYIKTTYSVDGQYIIFKIEDTGIGIPQDKIRYVFDRFWQSDSSSRKKYKGVGLGMAISKSIAELLGGKIWLESEINKGTTFYVKILLEEVKHEIFKDNNETSFSDKNILIIDELPVNYSLLGIYLKSLNVKLLSTSSGENALKKYRKQKDKIDLIILDVNLPDMETDKIITKINEIKKCIIITKSDRITKIKKTDNNSDYHISNPIDKDHLLSILNKIWKK